MHRHVIALIGVTLLALSTAVGNGVASADSFSNRHNGPRGGRHPLLIKTCVDTSPSGNCSAYVDTYVIGDLSCTEDCQSYGSFDRCQLKSTCHWDAASGCFIKSVCSDVGEFNRCEQWDQQVACL